MRRIRLRELRDFVEAYNDSDDPAIFCIMFVIFGIPADLPAELVALISYNCSERAFI